MLTFLILTYTLVENGQKMLFVRQRNKKNRLLTLTQMLEVKNVYSHSSTKVYPTTNAQQLNPTTMCHGVRFIFNVTKKYLKTVDTGGTVNMTVLEELKITAVLLGRILRCENVVILDILAGSVRAIVIRTLNVQETLYVERTIVIAPNFHRRELIAAKNQKGFIKKSLVATVTRMQPLHLEILVKVLYDHWD
jgi:hypothetical protein